MPARRARKAAKPRKRDGIAAALKSFKPKIVQPRKGGKAYRRKLKHPKAIE